MTIIPYTFSTDLVKTQHIFNCNALMHGVKEVESMNPKLKVELITTKKEKRGGDQASTECGTAVGFDRQSGIHWGEVGEIVL